MRSPHKIYIILIAILFSALPVTGTYYGLWSWETMRYLYWAEGLIAALIALVFYTKHTLVFLIILLLAGIVIGLKDQTIWKDLRVPVTFWAIYALGWLLYFEIKKSRFGRWVQRLPPLQNLLFYLFYMTAAIVVSFSLTATIYRGWDLVPRMPPDIYIYFLVTAAVIPTLTIGALKIIDMIGPRHVLLFLLGTYHRPVERQRIVMFMDMVGSSSMAEKLTPKKSMALIAQFIFDASQAFREHGGDILNYTGDGLVVTWPFKNAARPLMALEALERKLRAQAKLYKKKFGIVPDFRAGLYGGDVVISQIGEERLFLGLYGDTVNTAARLEELNKTLGTKVLFSHSVKQQIPLMKQKGVEPCGTHEIRGQNKKVEVFTLKKWRKGKNIKAKRAGHKKAKTNPVRKF